MYFFLRLRLSMWDRRHIEIELKTQAYVVEDTMYNPFFGSKKQKNLKNFVLDHLKYDFCLPSHIGTESFDDGR